VHLSHFYKTADDLQDLLVPYFKAGLENNESCLWVTAAPLGANQARSALRSAVPDFDRREKNRQIEIRCPRVVRLGRDAAAERSRVRLAAT